MLSKTKWMMKQYWRIGTIRAISSLVLGMLVLGRFYYIYFPPLADLGFLGALTLGAILTLIFLGLGWAYDQKANMWSQKTQVATERNAYHYVPNYKNLAFDYPVLYAINNLLNEVLINRGLDTTKIKELNYYLADFFSRNAEKDDIESAMPKSLEFLDPYFHQSISERNKIPFGARVKLVFETSMLRLSWIQSLTGMLQDALVFGALYVLIIFPGVDDPLLKLIYGTVLLSFPLYIFLTALGWYYDRKLKVWSPDAVVKVERTPYTYVLLPRQVFLDIPFLYAYLTTMKDVFGKLGLDSRELDRLMDYLSRYMDFDASREADMESARKLRSEYGPIFQKKGVE